MSISGFWRDMRIDNRRVVVRDYGVISNLWFLFPQGNGPRGAFTTFADLKPNLRSRDTVILSGVLREQAVMPDDVYEIAFIGAAGIPRQATDGGVPTGGGATWMPPSSGAVAATPLIEVVRQGCSFENISFTPHTSSGGVRLTTAGGLDEAGQTRFKSCLFGGQGGTGQIGIEDNGGSGYVVVEDCDFQNLAFGLKGISTANAVPLGWRISKNRFRQNTNDIAMSLSYALIERGRHFTAGSGATNKVISTTYVSVQGGNNQILLNQFNNTEAQIAPGSGYTGAASDLWMNYVNDQAALAFGQPA